MFKGELSLGRLTVDPHLDTLMLLLLPADESIPLLGFSLSSPISFLFANCEPLARVQLDLFCSAESDAGMLGGVAGEAVCGFGSPEPRSRKFDVCSPSRHHSISDCIL